MPPLFRNEKKGCEENICIAQLALAASSWNPRDIQLVVHLFSSQHTGSFTAQHYLKSQNVKVCHWIVSPDCKTLKSEISMDIPDTL